MKSNITLSIDHEIKEKLKDLENASGLINGLLISHFNMVDRQAMPIAERKAYLKKMIDRHELIEKHKKALARFDK